MGAPLSVGLRVDVDTFRGTRDGVPALLAKLSAANVRASFFFSVGPDNMGRHLARLLRPAFLWKMLRSRAPSLYGWDVLLRGTLGPGPRIGERLGDVLRRTAEQGHEVGFHAWDHHAWQTKLERFDQRRIEETLERGVACLTRVLGRPPECTAAAGWRCDERVLLAQERFGFRYASDCRGRSIFRPRGPDGALTPQVPVTLPTYDELIGHDGVDDSNYNLALLARVVPDELNVLAIHAEVEGLARAALFDEFLGRARHLGMRLIPLGELLREERARVGVLPGGVLRRGRVEGREGWVAVQGEARDERAAFA